MNSKKKEILIVILFLIVQTVLYVIGGMQKQYLHMDEAYSLGLASYERTEIQANEDFYDKWHTKEYYEDYLSVEDDEVGKYNQVYENQKNDVHPPLYYLILRFAMGFSLNHFSMWPGIIVNIIIYIFVTLVMYFILQKLFEGESRVKEKSIILAFLSSITMASLTTVFYIRMYGLATLNILITTLLHIKLLENKDGKKLKILIPLGLSVIAGVLTHYYYLFFLFMMYLVFAIKYIRKKEYKNLAFYTITMIVSGVLSLIIWPYSIKHMFFGYRGQGAMDNLTKITQFFNNIIQYIFKLNYYGFNNLLFVILIVFIMLLIYKKLNENKEKLQNEYTTIILIPTIFYFIVVAIASPWIEIRYIMPICGLAFILVIYYLYKLLKSIYKEKAKNIIIGVILVMIFISPFVFKIEPETLYSDKKEIVSKLGNELNVPTIFFFNSSNNRFLDDILLFSTVDESYIAKDMDVNENNIKNIFENKDISNGIVVFINAGQNNDDILEKVGNSFEFNNTEYLKRLNACDVYYCY